MNKILKVIVCLSLSITILGMSDVTNFHNLSSIPAACADSINVHADIIDWRYKVVDDHLYRRLYNYSTQEWIGEWEIV